MVGTLKAVIAKMSSGRSRRGTHSEEEELSALALERLIMSLNRLKHSRAVLADLASESASKVIPLEMEGGGRVLRSSASDAQNATATASMGVLLTHSQHRQDRPVIKQKAG